MADYPKILKGIMGNESKAKVNTKLFINIVGQYFPEVIKDGEIDFDALKEEMGEFKEIGSEHYSFNWAGKQDAKKQAQTDIFGKTLKFKPCDSLNAETTENIYIEGDNLEVLKLIRRNYYGKIKMIYIDPPYNTGSDFIYNDDFKIKEDEIAKMSGNIIDGRRLQKNNKDNARYHTNWLNMMYPRLKIARDLLADDGVIFISIDDNEQGNLRKICDEIFREENFIANICHKARASISNDKIISTNHNHILLYAKNQSIIFNKRNEIGLEPNLENFNLQDERGFYKLMPVDGPGGAKKGNPYYEFMGIKGYWRYSLETMQQKYNEGLIIKSANSLQQKYYLEEAKNKRRTDTTWWEEDLLTSNATKEFIKIMGGKFFDSPKNVNLLIRMLKLFTYYDKNSIILDFFSGSATTAHAVMQLNAEDDGHRKFIMVQIPELCDTKSEAYKEGYQNICEIGKERIRRAAIKIHEKNPEAVFDDGFKVFETANTNIRWNKMSDEDLFNIDQFLGDKDKLDFNDGYTDIDIVYEIILRQYGIPLSTNIKKLVDIGNRTYIFAYEIVVCLENKITDELIKKLANIKPLPTKYIFRDSAFDDDIEFKDISYRKLNALIKSQKSNKKNKADYNNFAVEFI